MSQLWTLAGFGSVTPFPARNGGNETGDLGFFLTPDVIPSLISFAGLSTKNILKKCPKSWTAIKFSVHR